MKKYIFQIALAAALLSAILTTGCKKDWLSPAPENTLVSSDSTFFDKANAEKFVNSCYNWGITWGQHVFSWTGVSSITSDDADKGSDPGDLGTDKDQMDALSYGPTSLSIIEVWDANFTGIGRCNQAVENAPKFVAAGLDQATADRLVGEAKFLRAYYYFNLVRCYGNVPKIARVYSSDEIGQVYDDYTNTPAAEIYAQIEEDLRDAAAKLPLKNAYAAKDLGRATKGSAQGLLAKVLMYEKKWQECYDLCNEIIGSGQYSLAPNFAEIFRQAGEHGSESLFEFEGQNGNEGWGIGGYAETQMARGKVKDGFGGWGFNTPSDDLIKAFEAGDARKAATYYSVGQTLWDGAVVETAANTNYNYKAYASKAKEANYDSWSSGKNLRILRFGEILLIKAEAANELGKATEAASELNKVRKRAGLGDTPATSQADLRTAIWKERRVELAMEHDRWFDLVRTGRAGSVMRAHGKNFVDGKHELFPIPQIQIDLSGGRIKQNPGY